MKVGFSKVEITPDVGVPLAGYLKPRISEGVHSPLYARALVMKNWGKSYLWLSLDLIAIDHNFMVMLKDELDVRHFRFHDVEVFATHTHSGPQGTCESGAFKEVFGDYNREYLRHVVMRCMHAVKEATIDLSKFELRVAQCDVEGVAASRHSEEVKVPNKLTTILCSRNKREDILLYHFACHPTILHDDNVEISSDFVGEVENQLTQDYQNVMFLNGSCGNISTRFTRQSATKDEVVRLSSLLAEKIRVSLDTAQPFDVNKYHASHYSYDMKKKKLGTIDEAEKLLDEVKVALEKGIESGLEPQAIRLLESLYEGAKANYLLVEHDDGSLTHEVHLSIIKLNKFMVICIPAELFSTLEEQIECENCIVVNYANGYHAYFADEDAYEHGYYESHMSYYEKGESEKLIHYINKKIDEINKR